MGVERDRIRDLRYAREKNERDVFNLALTWALAQGQTFQEQIDIVQSSTAAVSASKKVAARRTIIKEYEKSLGL